MGMTICGNWTIFCLCLIGFLNNFSVMLGQIFLGSQYYISRGQGQKTVPQVILEPATLDLKSSTEPSHSSDFLFW